MRPERSLELRICFEDSTEVLGRGTLFVLRNDLHKRPFGFVEDIFVEEKARGKGIFREIMKRLIELARENGCYKLIACVRYLKPEVKHMYLRLGFLDHGSELRMNFV